MESFADSKTLYPFLHEPTASKIIKMERERERDCVQYDKQNKIVSLLVH
jgi:hypothetical protein